MIDGVQLTVTDIRLLKRENLVEWISWAFFASKEIEDHEIDEMDRMISQIHDLFGFKLESGYNPDLEAIKLGTNNIDARHRPFVLYAALVMLEFGGYCCLNIMGYRFVYSILMFFPSHHFRDKNTFSYYHRKSPVNTTKSPIVFFHGIGGGLFAYLKFIYKLNRISSKRDVFLVEIPHISMKLVGSKTCHDMVTTVRNIQAMLEGSGFHSAHFIGHSLGSVVCAWIVRFSKLVKRFMMRRVNLIVYI
jgi:hypothetical protein